MKPRHAAALALMGWYLLVPLFMSMAKKWRLVADPSEAEAQ